MTYSETMKILNDFQNLGIVPGLDSIRRLLNELGDPQDNFQVVHIAGTNGKGSVSAFLSSILKEAGIKTGCYTSPAVFEYTERYRINGESIEKEVFGALFSRVVEACDRIVAAGFPHPTVFEVETALCFLYFSEQNVDIAVIECGLGGREDATNVFDKNICSLVTNISYDHVGILGDTLEAITYQKAGIIKQGCPVVTVNTNNEVLKVLRAEAERVDSVVIMAMADSVNVKEQSMNGQIFSYKTSDGTCFDDLKIHLLGTYQLQNASIAIEAAQIVSQSGFLVNEDAIRRGLENAAWPGRFEVVHKDPLVILDGAHNPDGIDSLKASITKYLNGYHLYFTVAIFKDKNHLEMIRSIVPMAEAIVATETPGNVRALPAKILAEEIRAIHKNVECCQQLEDAYKTVVRLCRNDEFENKAIIIFGSLSHLGDFKKIIQGGCCYGQREN